MSDNPTKNHFIEQSRRDLAGGVSTQTILAYARYHVGMLRNLAPNPDLNRKIAEAEAFIRGLEGGS